MTRPVECERGRISISTFRKIKRILVLLVLSATSAWCQSDRGTIRGTVLDPAGAAVPGAKVTAINVATGIPTATISEAAGNYNIPALPVGVYKVEAEASGFKKLARENIHVNASALVALDLTLELGATSQTVSVTAAAPQLEKESTDLKTTVNPEAFAELPLAVGNGRNPTAFATLAPGTKTGEPGQFGGFFATTFNGGQTLSGEVELDGMSVNYPPAQGQPDAVTGIAPEAIEEVSIVTGGSAAEYKGGTGTQRYTIRSGTNQFHGNLYEFVRNDLFDARSFFSKNRGKQRRNEFGGSLGGPIWIPGVWKGTDRSFFFMNIEAFRLRTTPTTTTTTVPTMAFKQGDFSQLKDANGNLIQLYDPATTRPNGLGGFVRDPFVGNVIPSSRFSTVAKNVMAYFPDPNRPGIVNNFIGTSPSPFNQNRLAFKFDHRFTSSQTLTASWVSFYQNSISGSVFGQPNGGQPNAINGLMHGTGRLSVNSILSPRVINNAEFGFNRRNREVSYGVPTPWDIKLAIQGLWPGDCAFPSFSFQGQIFGAPYQRLGTGTGDPGELDVVDDYQFKDTISVVRGKHNLKFGAEARWTRNNYALPTGCGGFNFSRNETGFPSPALSGTTGDSFASLLIGSVDNASWGINNVRLAARWHYYAGFAQDDLKLTRNLTLNLGLRWDLYLPLFDKFDNFSIMDPDLPNPAAGGTLGAMIFAGHGPGRIGRRRLTNGLDLHDFSPHVGFAWSVKPNLVIRAAGDITYFPSYPYGTGNFRGIDYGFSTGAGIGSPNQGITPAFALDGGFPLKVPQPPFIDPGYGVGQGVSMFWPTAYLLSYMQTWNFGIQYQLPKSWMIDLGYVGNAGSRLVSGTGNNPDQVNPKYLSLGNLLLLPINDPAVVAAGFQPPYPGFVQSFPTTPTLAQALRPFPQYAGVDTGPSSGPSAGSANIGHSAYHSFQAKLQKQLSQGLFMLTSFTYSKLLTDSDSSWGSFFSPGARDFYNRKLEKALSPSNPPYRLTSAFNYELPIGPRKKFLNAHGPAGKILEGWQVNGILTYQSGFPIVPGFTNTLPLFNSLNLPNVVPGVSEKMSYSGRFDPATDRYLNANAFQAPPPFTFGNAPAVLKVRDFALFNEDIGIMKRTWITENRNIEFRWEVFNAANRVRFATPSAAFATPGFGTVGGQANSPRTMQFALKLNF